MNSSTSVDMEKVADSLREVYKKDLMNLPVSCDLVRLCRKFTIMETVDETPQKIEFADTSNDPLDKVLYSLLHMISDKLFTDPALGDEKRPDKDDLSLFQKEVNMQVFETLTNYILMRFGEKSRVIRVLKSCNQSFVIATLTFLRLALMNQKLMFKDCRGEWYLELWTNKNGKPTVVQRRKEQVFRFGNNGVPVNTFRFEWDVSIEFDSLMCKSITRIEIRLLQIDFSGVSEDNVPPAERQESEQILRKTFENLLITTPDLHFELV